MAALDIVEERDRPGAPSAVSARPTPAASSSSSASSCPSSVLPSPAERLAVLERLVRAIEDELVDDELDDEQRLQNIGERLASVMDGR